MCKESQVPWVQAGSITWKWLPRTQQEASFNQHPYAQASFGAENGELLFVPSSPIRATNFSFMGPWWSCATYLSWGNPACPSGERASVGWLDLLLFHKDINNIQGVIHEWQICAECKCSEALDPSSKRFDWAARAFFWCILWGRGDKRTIVLWDYKSPSWNTLTSV